MYHELKVVTPDSLQPLLHDLFAANTFWELKTEQATAKQTKTGAWQVTLNLQARKFVVDSIGVETKAPIKDWVEVGIFGPAQKGEERGKLLYLKKHLINSPNQTVTILVPGKPAKACIDPNYLLVDWELKDNTQDVKM